MRKQKLHKKPEIKFMPFNNEWILFEDDELIVVNKPTGLLSVPGRNADPLASLIGQVNLYCPQALIVHRLDMDTSGIMVLAKGKETHKKLSRQFQDRLTNKSYQAICSGIASQKNGSINLPMRCDWENRPLQRIDFRLGKHAKTNWEIISQQHNCFNILLHPITGRSHQLRLHMQQMGHPILGDNLYSDRIFTKKVNRLHLHSSKLSFTHPATQEMITIENTADFWHI
jgi:tRNA pseudouridine32 synthase/23S rRNA pseudouridine746 synthase